MSADERIVEALDERWPSFPFERFKDTDGIPCLASVYAREVAEAIEPIIRAREAKAWDGGYVSGHSNAMRQMSDEPSAPTTRNPHQTGAAQ